MGNDPPGSFTRVLHPRLGRHDEPPPEVIPIGRSVIVPANGSLPNIILSPRSVWRIRRVLETGALRPRPHPRADDADARARDDGPGPLPDRRDLPRVRRALVAEAGKAGLGLPARPSSTTGSPSPSPRARRPPATSPGDVRADPERRPRPGPRRMPAGAGRPDRLHRPAGASQGPAGPAPRLARDPTPDRRAAAGDRRRSARGPAALRAPARVRARASTCSASFPRTS